MSKITIGDDRKVVTLTLTRNESEDVVIERFRKSVDEGRVVDAETGRRVVQMLESYRVLRTQHKPGRPSEENYQFNRFVAVEQLHRKRTMRRGQAIDQVADDDAEAVAIRNWYKSGVHGEVLKRAKRVVEAIASLTGTDLLDDLKRLLGSP